MVGGGLDNIVDDDDDDAIGVVGKPVTFGWLLVGVEGNDGLKLLLLPPPLLALKNWS